MPVRYENIQYTLYRLDIFGTETSSRAWYELGCIYSWAVAYKITTRIEPGTGDPETIWSRSFGFGAKKIPNDNVIPLTDYRIYLGVANNLTRFKPGPMLHTMSSYQNSFTGGRFWSSAVDQHCPDSG